MSTQDSSEPCSAVDAAICDECGKQMHRSPDGRVYSVGKISYKVRCKEGHVGVVHITRKGTTFDGLSSGEEYL